MKTRTTPQPLRRDTADKEVQALLGAGNAGQLESDVVYTTQLHVLKSNAYYIGQLCVEEDHGFWSATPYSRESGYFPTREAAEAALEGYRQSTMQLH